MHVRGISQWLEFSKAYHSRVFFVSVFVFLQKTSMLLKFEGLIRSHQSRLGHTHRPWGRGGGEESSQYTKQIHFS